MEPLPIQFISYGCQSYLERGYPNLTPTISYLSSYAIPLDHTSSEPFTVYLRGTNFANNGVSTITFGKYKEIPIVFYSSTSISFVVPMNAKADSYEVRVVNSTINGKYESNGDVFMITE